MEFTNISLFPHSQNIPGRQDAIDHAGRIDKEPYVVVLSIFFGTAILCVVARFGIRFFGHRKIGWDDGFVLLAAIGLAAGFGVCIKMLNVLFLVEAINKKVVAFPFQEEVPQILEVTKWSAIFAVTSWTSVYLVKFAFMNFFYALIQGMPSRITRFYWSTVGISIVCWIYTVSSFFIVCPHFGADSFKCGAYPHQHVRSLVNNILVSVVDIGCDSLIVTLPIIVLNLSMMSFARKLSLAAILCLSIAMIICALARIIGTILDTDADGNGSAPTWATFWAVLENCVSVIMTTVITIRSVFINQPIQQERRQQDSALRRFVRRRLPWLRSGKHGTPRSVECQQFVDAGAPKIATLGLTQATMSDVRRFVSGSTDVEREDVTLKTVDTGYTLEHMDYHSIQRDGIKRSATATSEMNSEGPN
ncbi:uncharacterized protein F4822DRAFT_171120 [Hypoxylon trugodes]|uniref:uncharacterized protein n=1 Tax=Hypoxylon trugodes TaxID=326681 RepID=UPI002195B98E|nr:uncharacterized protein F4822DRAFT_171120 [Hypoxylon trugodes]KAI1391050.1 hypothetical protein F4822DRAFT_171120 [Hypoxylon trugodes]